MTSRPERGFTLLEMLVVIAVLGLATALVMMRSRGPSPAVEARAAADRVAAALRAARGRAILHDRTETVVLDARAHRLRLADAPPLVLPRVLAVGGSGEIRFASDGSSSGGKIVLAGGGARAEVTVSWLTGRVSDR